MSSIQMNLVYPYSLMACMRQGHPKHILEANSRNTYIIQALADNY